LHEQLENCTARKDRAGWLAADDEFHCALYEIGGNRCLLRIIRDLRKVIRLVGYPFLLLNSGLQQPLEEHRGIIAAIRRQDAAAVKECVRAHLLTCGRVIAANRWTSAAGSDLRSGGRRGTNAAPSPDSVPAFA
jgi:DNA-binding GntR family transcriptional regulator